jgi:glyoxylase-like metal-dependent hydrolase (beta-lactamase superfamily II)
MRILLAAVCAFSLLAADLVRTADPAKRGFKPGDLPRLVKVADNVYTWEDFHAGSELYMTVNMFVVTEDGVLLADAQGDPQKTKRLVDEIHKITPKPIRYVIICSDHGDHTGGNSSLPAGAKYYIHPASKAILDAQKNGWKPPADAELVTDKTVIRMGGEEFQILFLGRAHTGGDLTVFLPRRNIIFMSETFSTRLFPQFRSGYGAEWLRALDRAEAMNAAVYIPGHGFTEDGPTSKEELREYHAAVKAVVDEVTRLYKAGVPVEEAVKQASWPQYADWTGGGTNTRLRDNGAGAVRRIYAELGAR